MFNAGARTRDECLRCFCFDLTTDCVSSSLYLSEVSALTQDFFDSTGNFCF